MLEKRFKIFRKFFLPFVANEVSGKVAKAHHDIPDGSGVICKRVAWGYSPQLHYEG
jgi:hypothetical protein